jgi:hypothetical protein
MLKKFFQEFSNFMQSIDRSLLRFVQAPFESGSARSEEIAMSEETMMSEATTMSEETTMPEETTISEETPMSEETISEVTISEETISEETMLEEKMTMSEETMSDDITSIQNKVEQTVPEDGKHQITDSFDEQASSDLTELQQKKDACGDWHPKQQDEWHQNDISSDEESVPGILESGRTFQDEKQKTFWENPFFIIRQTKSQSALLQNP